MPVTIDVGTTAVKVIHFNEQHEIINIKTEGYPTMYGKNGEAEQDPDQVVKAVFTCLNALRLKQEDSIVLSCVMHSLMAVDEAFHAHTKLMIWADRRADDVIKVFKHTDQANSFFKKTKTPIHPMSPFAKLLWFKDNESILANKKRTDLLWIDIKTYLWYHLTGYNELDYSLASATGLVDSDTKTYDEAILHAVDIHRQQLSPLVPVTWTREVTNEVKKQLGYRHHVMIGASDGVLANISEGMNKRTAHITIGTSGAIRMTVPKPYTDETGQLFCYYLNETNWVIGGAVNNGGNVLKWLDDLFFEGTSAIYAYLETLDFNTYDSDLVFIPHLNGERAPFWDTNRTGIFYGLKISHTKEQLVIAVIYGLLFNLRHVFDTLQTVTGTIEEVYLSGGFFKVAQLKTLLSQVLNVRVIESLTLEQTSIGALRLLVNDHVQIESTYETMREQPSKQLDAYYERYLDLVLQTTSESRR